MEWGGELLQAFGPIAQALDAAHGSKDYSQAVQAAGAVLQDAAALPSARVLAAMAEHDNSFQRFTRERSQRAREALLALPWSAQQQVRFEALAEQSRLDQKAIEAADTLPFEIFRQEYVCPSGLAYLPARRRRTYCTMKATPSTSANQPTSAEPARMVCSSGDLLK